MYLELKNINKSFGDRKVIDDLCFGVEKGELICLLGESGCGKTTTLNIIGGFLSPDKGSVTLDGADITALQPEQRPVTTVFQSYSLFVHMNVIQNVMYGLKFKGYSKTEAKDAAMRYLELIGLKDYAKARIGQLSGGQQQRVAIARALVVEPKILLLDEPFCNLDAGLRVKMREELKEIQKKLDITMIFVTHDQEEALEIADKIGLMQNGKFVQIGTPRDFIESPANDYVRDFFNLGSLVKLTDGSLVKPVKLR